MQLDDRGTTNNAYADGSPAGRYKFRQRARSLGTIGVIDVNLLDDSLRSMYTKLFLGQEWLR